MKEGDKVVCIFDHDIFGNNTKLTIGRIYDIYIVGGSGGIFYYNLLNDEGVFTWHNSNLFISLEEYRERQIKKILE